MLMPGRNGQSGDYRYGFNGKEMDNDFKSETGTIYDYGFRIYNTRIAKFLSVDPLTKDYPSWSPYPFAMNRPIDGIDLDGLEWENKTDENGNTTNISVNTILDAKDVDGIDIEPYKSSISDQLNLCLQNVSEGKILGAVTYNGGESKNQLIPTIVLSKNFEDQSIAGTGSWGVAFGNLLNKDGTLKSPEQLAVDVIHELLHGIRLEHPFEFSQGSDTKLINDKGNYLTTETTDPNIIYNVMNYPYTKINGMSWNDIPNPKPLQGFITKDQLKVMIIEINLQMQGGYGINPPWKKGLTNSQLKERYDKYYGNYWHIPNGKAVPRKK